MSTPHRADTWAGAEDLAGEHPAWVRDARGAEFVHQGGGHYRSCGGDDRPRWWIELDFPVVEVFPTEVPPGGPQPGHRIAAARPSRRVHRRGRFRWLVAIPGVFGVLLILAACALALGGAR